MVSDSTPCVEFAKILRNSLVFHVLQYSERIEQPHTREKDIEQLSRSWDESSELAERERERRVNNSSTAHARATNLLKTPLMLIST